MGENGSREADGCRTSCYSAFYLRRSTLILSILYVQHTEFVE